MPRRVNIEPCRIRLTTWPLNLSYGSLVESTNLHADCKTPGAMAHVPATLSDRHCYIRLCTQDEEGRTYIAHLDMSLTDCCAARIRF